MREPNESPRSAKRQKTSSEAHRARSSPDATRTGGIQTRFIPYPAGYDGYPSLTDLTKYINEAKVIDTVLPTSAVDQVLRVLVYDDKLIKMKRQGKDNEGEIVVYKARRTPDVVLETQGAPDSLEGNGMTEIPCGRCPVFDLCEEGGPVSASNCEYWDKWIQEFEF